MSYLGKYDSGAEKPLHHQGLLAMCKVWFATQQGVGQKEDKMAVFPSLMSRSWLTFPFPGIWLTYLQFLFSVCSRAVIVVISSTSLVTQGL